jgi:hypothetical protein
MKSLIISALLCLSLASPAAALTSEEATKVVKWATGDTITVTVDRDYDAPNGYFSWMGGQPEIVVFQPEWMPDAWAIIILLHEAAHYIQWRDGYIDSMESVDREWQADIWGINAACQIGGTNMDFHDLWVWMLEEYGDVQSGTHGQHTQRMLSGMRRAHACIPRFEAPWVQA